MDLPLLGKNILLTRPAHQAEPLAEKIRQLGGNPLFFPTIDILPTTDNTNLVRATQHLADFQIIIFTSANAVRFALPLWPKLVFCGEIVAIGPGTADELKKNGISNVSIPQSHHSEGLLALGILKNVAQKKIAIFSGENPRTLLTEMLSQRGAQVDPIFCYRRALPQIDIHKKFEELEQAGINLIVSTSLESLMNLWQLLEKIAKVWLQQIPLLVINPAMVSQAQLWGIKSVKLANGASDQAIYAKLRDLTENLAIRRNE